MKARHFHTRDRVTVTLSHRWPQLDNEESTELDNVANSCGLNTRAYISIALYSYVSAALRLRIIWTTIT